MTDKSLLSDDDLKKSKGEPKVSRELWDKMIAKFVLAGKLRKEGKYEEARKLEYGFKLFFNARCPNPDVCHTCGRKM